MLVTDSHGRVSLNHIVLLDIKVPKFQLINQRLTLSFQVWYDAEGFLEKNRDSISSDLLSVIMSSKNHFIADLFVASMSETGTISG